MVRLPLLINKQRIKTLEELRENFNLTELIERYKGGQLRAWLNCWDFSSELEQVEALSPDLPELEFAETLCRIFGIDGEVREQALTVIKEKLFKEEQERQREEQRKKRQERQRKADLEKTLSLFEWQEREIRLSGLLHNFNHFADVDPYLYAVDDALYLCHRNNSNENPKEHALCYTYDGYHWQPSQPLPVLPTREADTLHSWEGIGKHFRCNFVPSSQEFGVVSRGAVAEISDDGIHWRELEYVIHELVTMKQFLVALFHDAEYPELSIGFHVSVDGIHWRKLSTPLPKGKLACFGDNLLIMYGIKVAFGKINVQDVQEAINGATPQQNS